MKKWIIPLLALILIPAALILGIRIGRGEEEKTPEMKGPYRMAYYEVNGWKMGPEEFDMDGNFSIPGIDDNSISILTFYDDGEPDVTTGYINTASVSADCIKYKYWVTSHYGNYLTADPSFIYLYYYPADNRIMIDCGEVDIHFTYESP